MKMTIAKCAAIALVALAAAACGDDHYDPTGITMSEQAALARTSEAPSKRRAVAVRGAEYDVWLFEEPDWCLYAEGDLVMVDWEVSRDGAVTPVGWWVLRATPPIAVPNLINARVTHVGGCRLEMLEARR